MQVQAGTKDPQMDELKIGLEFLVRTGGGVLPDSSCGRNDPTILVLVRRHETLRKTPQLSLCCYLLTCSAYSRSGCGIYFAKNFRKHKKVTSRHTKIQRSF